MDLISIENHLEKYRKNIVGYHKKFSTPYGEKQLIYADWIASGRLYGPIEDKIKNTFGPFVGNTHTETNVTGTAMTLAYEYAKNTIKKHVNASKNDSLLSCGSGMTGVLAKFQRFLGIKIPEKYEEFLNIPDEMRPVVFITHAEHHSNQTSWLESIAITEVINPDADGRVDLNNFRSALEKHKNRSMKIASVTACSNVTGYKPPIHEIASLIHEYGGYCLVDYACSAPYVKIDMHPENEKEKLDAIFFSPHKFLGGPGTCGVMIFDKALYHNRVPDQPGGGTVKWTNPWGEHSFFEDIEMREDGGTPPFLQTIKTALCVLLKEEIGLENIEDKEQFLVDRFFNGIENNTNIHVLAPNIKKRLGVISLYIDGMHYNLGVKLLNDRFGIQVRGGCSCAGTYGHYLLGVSKEQSHKITEKIDIGDLSDKPGWIRVSLHPLLTIEEIDYIINAINELSNNHEEWSRDYNYNSHSNDFTHKSHKEDDMKLMVSNWFERYD